MANTQRFRQLKDRIEIIENSYLPEINLTGSYTDKEQDDIRAYLLLVHAEIESYFEDVTEKKAKQAFENWKLNREKSNVLLALVSFHDGKKIIDNNLIKRINDALTSYIQKLRKNHGIKKENLFAILLPIGIEYGEIDQTWLTLMDNFGTNRGVVAHKTAIGVVQQLDPTTLKNDILLIINELEKIDDKLNELI